MYSITVTRDFFADHTGKPVEEGNLTGPLLAAFLDSTGVTWYAFELPDVYGCWVIQSGSRFLVSIDRQAGKRGCHA